MSQYAPDLPSTSLSVELVDAAVDVPVLGADPTTAAQFDGDASDVPYGPGTPGDWDTPPTDVSQALDELAGRETSGGGGEGGTIQRWGLGSQERIALLATGTPIAVPNTGAWDDLQLRETGQAIRDRATGKWFAPYSARRASDAFASIGAALSDDGETWTAHPQNPIAAVGVGNYTNAAHEDPYVCKDLATGEVWRNSSGRALMFTEEKDGATQVGINLFLSGVDTLSDWTLFGQVLATGANDEWDVTDRDSPVVFAHNDALWMLFEGRHLPDQQGLIGLAVSIDEGETWDVLGDYWQVWSPDSDSSTTTALDGTWFELSLVPDDIDLIDGLFVLLCHGQGEDEVYHCGRFVSTRDPFTLIDGAWSGQDVLWSAVAADPIDAETDTIMCFGNDPTKAIHIDDAGQLRVQMVVPGSVPPLVEQVDDLSIAVMDLGTSVESLEDAVEPLAGLDVEVADLTGVVDSVSGDVDDLEAVVAEESALNAEQDLLTGRIAPRTGVAAWDFTTGTFGGPTPGGTLTVPGTVEAAALPWSIGSCGVLASIPDAPTAGARLIGAKARLTVDGVPVAGITASLGIFSSAFAPLAGRAVATGAWVPADGLATVQIADWEAAGIGDPHEVVLFAGTPVDAVDAGDYFLALTWASGGGATLGTGTAFDVDTVDWLWDLIPSDGGTPTGGAGGFLSGDYPDPGVNTEALQDAVGAMVTGNTESGGTLTYDDTNGKIDFELGSHSHPASSITSGTVATARLGSGTADAAKGLRGDQSWGERSRIIGGQGAGSQITNQTDTSLLASAITLPALATGEMIGFSFPYRFNNQAGANRSPIFKLKIGATTIVTLTPTVVGTNATDRFGLVLGWIRSNGNGDQTAWMAAEHYLDNGTDAGVQGAKYGVGTEAMQTAGLALDILGTVSTSVQLQLMGLTVWKVST